MEFTYTVRGADGQEYGPANLEKISLWHREGRISAATELRRSDREHWSPAGNFAELGIATAQAAALPAINLPAADTATTSTADDPAAIAKLKSGASWFYWIAGLSLVNSIAAISGGDWRFILGLGITQVIDAIVDRASGGAKAVVLFLDLLVAGGFVLFGVFAHKRHQWAFITGMVLFGLDGLIFLLVQDWLGIGFHVFVLYCLFRGLKACRQLNAS